jgi:hypothetical protein
MLREKYPNWYKKLDPEQETVAELVRDIALHEGDLRSITLAP